MTTPTQRARLAFIIILTALFASGCAAPHKASAPPTLDFAMGDAMREKRPLVILIVDSVGRDAHDPASSAFVAEMSSQKAILSLYMDIAVSASRAAAARFHALDGPTLVCLSPAGIVISRDEGSITAELIHRRATEAIELSPGLDAKLRDLSTAVDAKPDDVAARMALAEFLLSHHNDREAIPHLKYVADDDSADVKVRVRAWVLLGRSHLWVVEPEKARHAAQALIAVLGPKSPEAIAGGNLIRGLQDTKAKRYGAGPRDELKAAAAAAPDSAYGREAAELLVKLPNGGN